MKPSKMDHGERTANTKAKKPRLLKGLAVKDGFVRHPFDLEYGVRTSGLVAGRHLIAGHRHDRYATAYYAVTPSVFHGIVVRWRRCSPAAPLDEFTFIDLGAGMGRAMLLASGYPFRAVIGVELNPTLARIGRRNMALWRAAGRARAPLRMLCRDVVEFDLPPGPCVAFLFNPFGGPVMRRMLNGWSRNLAKRRDRNAGQLDILYVNNEQESVLEQHVDFKRLFHGKIRRSHADTLADRKILMAQPDGEYAFLAWENCSIYRWMGKAGD
ncbi:MAG: class I SAM-dependent methyltransferase [Terracidiphilus sp.]